MNIYKIYNSKSSWEGKARMMDEDTCCFACAEQLQLHGSYGNNYTQLHGNSPNNCTEITRTITRKLHVQSLGNYMEITRTVTRKLHVQLHGNYTEIIRTNARKFLKITELIITGNFC